MQYRELKRVTYGPALWVREVDDPDGPPSPIQIQEVGGGRISPQSQSPQVSPSQAASDISSTVFSDDDPSGYGNGDGSVPCSSVARSEKMVAKKRIGALKEQLAEARRDLQMHRQVRYVLRELTKECHSSSLDPCF